MSDRVFESFLATQYEEAMRLAAESDVLHLCPLGEQAQSRYIAQFDAKGLVRRSDGRVVEAEGFQVGIWFPPSYLRRIDVGQVITYLGPHRQPWHPNIRPPVICVHLAPGTPLVDVLHACYELWTWNLYYTGDEGLNHAAAQWARRQEKSRFPIDSRPLKRRKLSIRVTEEQERRRT